MLRTFTDVAKVEEPRHPHTLARVAGEGFSDDESDAESRRSSIAEDMDLSDSDDDMDLSESDGASPEPRRRVRFSVEPAEIEVKCLDTGETHLADAVTPGAEKPSRLRRSQFLAKQRAKRGSDAAQRLSLGAVVRDDVEAELSKAAADLPRRRAATASDDGPAPPPAAPPPATPEASDSDDSGDDWGNAKPRDLRAWS